jgi:hypothetical protein
MAKLLRRVLERSERALSERRSVAAVVGLLAEELVVRLQLSALRRSFRRTWHQVTRVCRIVDMCLHPRFSPPFLVYLWEITGLIVISLPFL